DRNVTGVQTCALPIWRRRRARAGRFSVRTLSPWPLPLLFLFRLGEMKKASRFREAFLIDWCATCVPLPSRSHARPRNEDDYKDAKEQVALHLEPVNATRCAGVNAHQRELCTLHSTDRP